MKREQVINCIFSQWYSQFRKITIDSRLIEIPTSVLDYLLADGLVLPAGAGNHLTNRTGFIGDSDDDEDWESTINDDASRNAPCFPEFQAQVEHQIEELGGSVFPKLNWSSPKDAVWISFGRTLRCTSFADIILLLKSSDFVSHDLTHPFDHCSNENNVVDKAVENITHHLVLRKWQEITPDSEFRCFVRSNNLVGISQRQMGIHFPSLVNCQQLIIEDIVHFFNSSIKDVFPDDDFTFDVWIKGRGNVILVDFNPFGSVTDSLLFTWEELNSDTLAMSLQCRFVTDVNCVEPDPYRFYAVPQDFVHLTTGEDPAKLIDLLHLKIQSTDSSTDSE